MGKSKLPAVLIGLLAFSGVLSAVFAFFYVQNVRTIRSLQPQLQVINNQQNIANAVVNETLEYSRTHPEINPLLESLKIKAPAAANAPKAK